MIGIPVKLYYMHVYEQSKTYGALNKNGVRKTQGRGVDCGVNKKRKWLKNAKKNTKIKRELNILKLSRKPMNN